jgi:hypothetical protein
VGWTECRVKMQTFHSRARPCLRVYCKRQNRGTNDIFRSCSKNMSGGWTLLLSPLDYTCSLKGLYTHKHVRTYT